MKITNYKLQITNNIQNKKPKQIKLLNLEFRILSLFVICYLVFGVLLVGNVAWAHTGDNDFWTPEERIVSCTDNCTKCELFHTTRNVIDFLMIAATPILATFFLIWAGFLIMMGGANPGMLSSGKRIFKDTIIGVLIVMLSWLIVNTLIKSLAKDTIPVAVCVNNMCTNGVGACNVDEDCGGTQDNSKWWEFSCSQLPGSNNPPPPQPLPLPEPGCTATVCVSGERATPTGDGAIITWTTNIPATSQVHYGPSEGQMQFYSPIDSSLKTSHRVVLSRLGSNLDYSYEVISTGGGYTAVGGISTFTTQ